MRVRAQFFDIVNPSQVRGARSFDRAARMKIIDAQALDRVGIFYASYFNSGKSPLFREKMNRPSG
jgi:hypothetical protein